MVSAKRKALDALDTIQPQSLCVFDDHPLQKSFKLILQALRDCVDQQDAFQAEVLERTGNSAESQNVINESLQQQLDALKKEVGDNHDSIETRVTEHVEQTAERYADHSERLKKLEGHIAQLQEEVLNLKNDNEVLREHNQDLLLELRELKDAVGGDQVLGPTQVLVSSSDAADTVSARDLALRIKSTEQQVEEIKKDVGALQISDHEHFVVEAVLNEKTAELMTKLTSTDWALGQLRKDQTRMENSMSKRAEKHEGIMRAAQEAHTQLSKEVQEIYKTSHNSVRDIERNRNRATEISKMLDDQKARVSQVEQHSHSLPPRIDQLVEELSTKASQEAVNAKLAEIKQDVSADQLRVSRTIQEVEKIQVHKASKREVDHLRESIDERLKAGGDMLKMFQGLQQQQHKDREEINKALKDKASISDLTKSFARVECNEFMDQFTTKVGVEVAKSKSSMADMRQELDSILAVLLAKADQASGLSKCLSCSKTIPALHKPGAIPQTHRTPVLAQGKDGKFYNRRDSLPDTLSEAEKFGQFRSDIGDEKDSVIDFSPRPPKKRPQTARVPSITPR